MMHVSTSASGVNYASVRRQGKAHDQSLLTVKVDHLVTVIWGLYWVIHAEGRSMH